MSGRRGAEYERRWSHFFEALGAACVRSAGSKGPADVVVLWPDGATWLVQVKATKDGRGASPAEREALARRQDRTAQQSCSDTRRACPSSSLSQLSG